MNEEDLPDDALRLVFAFGALIGQMATFRSDERIDAPTLAKDCFNMAEAMVQESKVRRTGT